MNGRSKISAERLKLLNRTPKKIVHLPVIVGVYRGEDGCPFKLSPGLRTTENHGAEAFALLSMRRHVL